MASSELTRIVRTLISYLEGIKCSTSSYTIEPLIDPSLMSLRQSTRRIANNQRVHGGLNAFVGSPQTYEGLEAKGKGEDQLLETREAPWAKHT